MSDLEPLIGAWRLVSFGITMVDTGQRTEPFGSHPHGRMILEPGGRIMFLFMSRERPSPQGDADRSSRTCSPIRVGFASHLPAA